ncbi:MAG: Wzz/FepE/Etk N-terminal domain-containing protein, partial [Bradyrhizobium guangdongense]
MLIYDEPINQAKPDRRPAAMPGGFSVLDLIQLLWRRKVAIASAALICACAAVAIGKSLTPKYTASAQLYVDPRELQLVDRELTPRAPDLNGLAMVVESQARVITSNNVLLQVIRETHLEKDPEFGGSDGKSLFGTLLGLFGIDLKPTAERQRPIQVAALETL